MTRSIQVKDKQHKEALLIIDGSELIINYEDERKERIKLEFIYGVFHKASTLIIHVASRATEPKGRRQETEWKVKEIEYEIVNQNDESTSFVDQLTRLCLPLRHQDTRILALINPSAGRQAAATHWESVVRPMLLAAGFKPTQLTTVLTEKNKTRQQAKKCANEQDWERTVLVVMGGDGTLHEVINGLLDGDTPNSPFQVGVIPVGSGNAFSLGLGIDGVIHATLRVIKGQTKPCSWMDVRLGQSDQVSGWEEEVSSEIVSRLLVVMSWGFHAQIVSKSRYLQYFMGNSRFSLVAGVLLTFLKQYSGELVLKDAVKYDSNTQGFSTEKSDKLIKDDQFTYFIVSKQPSLEKGFEIAPFASPLNDDMDIVLLRSASSKQLTEASMKAFEGGEHVKLPFVEYYKASELLLRVKHKTELCLDGEIHDLSPNGIIHLKVVGSNEPSFVVFV